jgi:hypothetical protein
MKLAKPHRKMPDMSLEEFQAAVPEIGLQQLIPAVRRDRDASRVYTEGDRVQRSTDGQLLSIIEMILAEQLENHSVDLRRQEKEGCGRHVGEAMRAGRGAVNEGSRGLIGGEQLCSLRDGTGKIKWPIIRSKIVMAQIQLFNMAVPTYQTIDTARRACWSIASQTGRIEPKRGIQRR